VTSFVEAFKVIIIRFDFVFFGEVDTMCIADDAMCNGPGDDDRPEGGRSAETVALCPKMLHLARISGPNGTDYCLGGSVTQSVSAPTMVGSHLRHSASSAAPVIDAAICCHAFNHAIVAVLRPFPSRQLKEVVAVFRTRV
jgi:hypothetical protein